MNKPWYKEFGVWMLLTPLLLIFVVCAVLVTFAVSGSDDPISDDYYKEGKMINNRFAAESLAKSYNLTADISVDSSVGVVDVHLQGAAPVAAQLSLVFSHPAHANRDYTVKLRLVSEKRYKGTITEQLHGRWYIRLEPELAPGDNGKWRLSGESNFDESFSLRLE